MYRIDRDDAMRCGRSNASFANLLGSPITGTTEDMARRKRTPEVSTIVRPAIVAYARKQKSAGGDDGDDDDDAKPEETKSANATLKLQIEQPAEVPDRPTQTIDPATLHELAEAAPVRGRVDTVGGAPSGGYGAPPEIPQPSVAGIVIKGGAVEDPTHMPGPRDIPPGSPDDVASPPGHVPPGDSRSLRRRGDQYEFALVYRQGNAVISRHGVVGTRGVWRVVEYPTSPSASNAFAREASRFVTDGFSDYRE